MHPIVMFGLVKIEKREREELEKNEGDECVSV